MNKEIKDRGQHAADLFMQGYNCGQAVVVAFADCYGLTEADAARISAAFGGGIGRQRMTCGAVLGMTVLAGLEEGNTNPSDKERMGNAFKAIQTLTEGFKQQYGSAVCAEILGLKGYVKADGPAQHQPMPECYKSRPCALKVKLAAQLFDNYLRSKQP